MDRLLAVCLGGERTWRASPASAPRWKGATVRLDVEAGRVERRLPAAPVFDQLRERG